MSRRPRPVVAATIRFGLAGLVAVLVLGALILFAVARISTDEALRSARDRARLAGHGIVEPALPEGLVDVRSAQDPRLSQLDELVQTRVMSERVVRVKIWTPDGRVVYSDEPRLIGQQYPAKEDHREVLVNGGISSEIASTASPENRFERGQHLLEVYLSLRTPEGGQVVYEQYEQYDSVVGNSRALLWRLAVPFGLGLGLLWLTQLPLARSLGRRVLAAEADRAELLDRAVTASEHERERIAADLHDGVVQDLAGLTFELAAIAPTVQDPAARTAIEGSADIARTAMRRLRTSLVDLHPADVQRVGLSRALDELAEPLRRDGAEVTVEVDPDANELDAEHSSLVYRVAQECLRNVASHAAARHVSTVVALTPTTVRLLVRDDGRGFTDGQRAARRADGHLGLDLQAALVRRAGGTLTLESTPGAGTVAVMEVPR